MPKLSDFKTRLSAVLKDKGSRLTSGDLDTIIEDALSEYSSHVPQIKAKEVDGDNGFEYALPAEFVEGFSGVQKILFPWDATDQDPPELEPKDFKLFTGPSGLRLRFIEFSPTTTQKFLLQFTIPHTIDTANPTSTTSLSVPEIQWQAFKTLCMCYSALAMADFFAQTKDSTIEGDTTDFEGKSAFWRDLAQQWREKFDGLIGRQKQPEETTTGAQGEWDRLGSLGRFRPLTHRPEDY